MPGDWDPGGWVDADFAQLAGFAVAQWAYWGFDQPAGFVVAR